MDKNLMRLREGESGEVKALRLTGEPGRRLMDLGFTPGARVTRLYSAPSGDPTAFLIRGSVIALRSDDARRVSLI